MQLQRGPALEPRKNANQSKDQNGNNPNHQVYMRALLQIFDRLDTSFGTGDRSGHHESGQFYIDVSEHMMFSGCDQWFSHDVEEIRADDKIKRNAHGKEGRSGQKAPADTKETAENANDKSEQD